MTIYPFLREESGATAIEYSLVASLIGLVLITAVTNIGAHVIGMFVAVIAGFN